MKVLAEQKTRFSRTAGDFAEPRQASPFGRGGGEADGEGKSALSPAAAGALPKGEPWIEYSLICVYYK